MLKTRDYDLWSMRMEQYLTHTDYALWEVIIIGDSLVPKPPAVGTVVPLKTKAQKLAKKNKLKAKSTLLLAITDEHLLKFHSIKDAKSLWEAIKISMDDLYNNLKVYEAEIKGKSSSGSNSYNVAFVSFENTSNINETVNAAHGIPAAGSKEQPFVSSYANDVMFSFFASQSNTLQLDHEDLEQIDIEDLEEMDLKWQVAMITMRVKKLMKRTGRNLNFNGKEPVGFDKTKVKCYNYHRRWHFARECHAPRNQGNRRADNERRVVLVETPISALVVQDGLGRYNWSYQAEEGPIDFALMTYSSDSANSSNSEIDEDNNQAKDRYKVGIWYHVVPPPYTRKYMPPRADLFFAGLDDSVFKFKISETRMNVNENESIASKSSEEIREEPKTVRSSAPIIEDWESNSMDECEDKTSTEQEIPSNDNSDKSAKCTKKYISKNTQIIMMKTLEKDRILGLIGMSKGTGQKEVRLVWNNARRVNHQNFSKMTHPHPKRNFVPTIVATKSGKVLVNATKQNSTASTSTARPKVNTAAIRPNVNAKSSYFNPHFPKRRHFNQRSVAKTNTFSRKINTAKVKNVTTARSKAVVNAAEGKKENYQEIDGGFVAFGGSLNGGKISDFKLLDESQVLLKVPRQNNMYSFDLKNVVPSGDLTCLFAKATIDESNLWHKRLGHINFKTLNKLMKGNLVRGSRPEWLFDIDLLTKSMNYEPISAGNQSNGDAGIQTDIHARQTSQEKAAIHEYILLPFISSNPPLSSTIQRSDVNAGDQPGDVNTGDIQGDVDEISRNDDVCQGNEIRIDSSTHAVNTASTSINTASNIIAAGSLNINTANFNHTNMPTLEATGIFNGAFDDRDLGAEADTNNLDSSIIVSHIPTTSVHKDHPKEQIIRDPNLNTKTRRIINFSEETAMVSFINRQRRRNHKDFQNCLFACFLSQMEPKKVIQALRDPSWI
nr:ribonuclease H-like domain-containing protein [Tanacetum cinerariifolium]